MKCAIVLAAFAAVFVVPSSAIICMECFGASSEQECNEQGKLRPCRHNQDACHIEYRRHEGWGGALKIYKQCKQSKACDNNYIQNPRSAWLPSQCNPDDFNSVCRCCCYEDSCNVARDDCFGRPGTGSCGLQPEYITRGTIYCTNGREHGSSCTVSCNANAKLVGFATTYCRYDGSWSQPLARCEQMFCEPRVILVNGWYICTNSVYSGSQCTANCRPGYTMVGSPTSSCRTDGFWSHYPPRCEPLQCPPRGVIAGGYYNCTDGNNLQSRCEAHCDGYRRLYGIVHSYCQDNGEWSHDLPTCELVECPPRGEVLHGGVSCTLDVQVNSFCTVICNDGYQADSVTESTCLPTGYWSEPLPRCQRIRCPDRGGVKYGSVTCSDYSFIGSLCSVACDYGMQLVGTVESECLGTGAWSNPLPRCQPVVCPERGTIINGAVFCKNRNFQGSVCTARCDAGTELVGVAISTCLPNGEWSDPLPSCGRIVCPVVDYSYESFGSMVCSDSNFYGSVCSFTCDPGYKLTGAPRISCLRNARWSTTPPTCSVAQCGSRGRVANGDVVCSDGNAIDSVCEVQCDYGYVANGGTTSTCLFPGRWNFRLPRCVSAGCPPRGRLIGGTVVCNDGTNTGSVCTAICGGAYEALGDSTSVCLPSGSWSLPLPICESNPCNGQGRLEHGSISCSRNWDVGSVCRFNCTGKDYQLYPPGRTTNICEANQRWNVPKPCCARPCPPYAVMDIVVVLDSSSSIGDDNWVELTAFVRNVLRSFVVAPDAANFAIFRYNRDVDTSTQILLNDHPGDLEQLVAAFNRIPYDGSGTFTGNALQHALDVSLARRNGNRPDVRDVVFVITDGKAADDVKTPADAIRATGATVLVLGIEPPRGSLDVDQLNDMAGGITENMIIARDGFAGLGGAFVVNLGRTICGKPCE